MYNTKHSLFMDIQSIVKKFVGIDQIVENIVQKLGDVKVALITGDYAKSIDSGIIDLVIIGEVDKMYLIELVEKSEELINRKIRTLVFTDQDFESHKDFFQKDKAIIVWKEV